MSDQIQTTTEDETIRSLGVFLKDPKPDSLSAFTIELRKELFGIKTKISPADLALK